MHVTGRPECRILDDFDQLGSRSYAASTISAVVVGGGTASLCSRSDSTYFMSPSFQTSLAQDRILRTGGNIPAQLSAMRNNDRART
jgi:hypothetical protein